MRELPQRDLVQMVEEGLDIASQIAERFDTTRASKILSGMVKEHNLIRVGDGVAKTYTLSNIGQIRYLGRYNSYTTANLINKRGLGSHINSEVGFYEQSRTY